MPVAMLSSHKVAVLLNSFVKHHWDFFDQSGMKSLSCVHGRGCVFVYSLAINFSRIEHTHSQRANNIEAGILTDYFPK